MYIYIYTYIHIHTCACASSSHHARCYVTRTFTKLNLTKLNRYLSVVRERQQGFRVYRLRFRV